MEQRSEYRIVYPLPARPLAMIGRRPFSTLDVSEQALRVDQRRVESPLVAGERVAGMLRLAQRLDHPFEGVVQRAGARSAVVRLDAAFRIDLPVIFQEQRCLRSRFPDWR
ncbi:MAG: hypothetical protein MUF07_05375 [Steroidobacteraceae bacterium]|nr:hypothetical protein [Steroidobacteraceae bacterium]